MPRHRWGQIVSLVLLNFHILGFFQGNLIYAGFLKGILAPILHCWSTPTALFSCPLGALQHFIALHLLPLYPLGVFILVAAFIGRMPCAWVCPFGLLQDILYKIKAHRWRLPSSVNLLGIILGIIIGYFVSRYRFDFGVFVGLPLSIFLGFILNKLPKVNIKFPTNYLKHLFLLGFVVILTYWKSEALFCRICPAGTLEAGLPLVLWDPEGYLKAMVGPFFYFKLFVLGFLLLSFIAIKRPFCRAMCPVGAIYSLANRLSLFHLQKKEATCPECRICERVCPMAIQREKIPFGSDCIRCLECFYRCPRKKIKVRWG